MTPVAVRGAALIIAAGVSPFHAEQRMDTEKPRTVLGYFNSIARRYDVMNTLLSFGLHVLWKKQAVRAAGLRSGDRVLDVCGGTADLAILAANEVGPGGQVTVYDFCMQMMLAGKQKTAAAPPDRTIRYVCGDAQQIAARDAAFDAALIGFGLRNLTDRAQGLREMYRILKQGGVLVCLEFSRPVFPLFRLLYNAYSFAVIPAAGRLIAGSGRAYRYLPASIRAFPLPEQLSAMLRDAGFSDITYRRLTNGVAAVHVGRKGTG